MIKANELRLENLIVYRGEIVPVYMIDRGGLTFSRINDVCVNKTSGATLQTGAIDFEPILLTSEWLARLMDQEAIVISNGLCYIDLDQGQQYSGLCIDHVKYVHQFQNLYFALTGNELSIKY
jgi:hypothetical protein